MARLNLKKLLRTFTMRTSDGFVQSFGPTLLARVGAEAPGVRLRFVQKPDKDGAHLRDGTIDLETGVVVASTSPELRAQALFRDRFVGVVRTEHALSKGKMTPEITVSLLWHPRLDADLAHHWLRGCVRDACAVRGTRYCERVRPSSILPDLPAAMLNGLRRFVVYCPPRPGRGNAVGGRMLISRM